jgi:hypothetical protein
MTEKIYRLVLGFSLLPLFYFEKDFAIFAIMGILLFEGITNLRAPVVFLLAQSSKKINFAKMVFLDFLSPDRILRFVIAGLIYTSTQLYGEALWFFPYFIGFALIYSGVTNICPMIFAIKFGSRKFVVEAGLKCALVKPFGHCFSVFH